MWRIECLLTENMHNEDEVIRDMASRMKLKFDKYWSDYSVVLALATVLDPRFKLGFLGFCYSEIGLDDIACQAKMRVVKHKLYSLFNEYIAMSSDESTTTTNQTQISLQDSHPASSSGSGDLLGVVMDKYIQYENKNSSQVGKSQLDTYLEEQKLSLAYHPNLDVLQYWKENKHRFPTLALMACDILSIQITTVASETPFSIDSCVLNKYQSSLLPENVQALICTRNWLLGYDVEGKQEDGVVVGESGVEPRMEISTRESHIVVMIEDN